MHGRVVTFRSSFTRASLYIAPLYAKCAEADFTLPMTKVFRRFNLTSSDKFCESTTLLHCSIHSCNWSRSPLYWVNFHCGNESFRISVRTSFFKPVRFSDQTMVYTRKKQGDAAAVLLLVQNPARYTHKNGL